MLQERIRGILDSELFRYERSVLGYTEIQGVKLATPFEQCKRTHDQMEKFDDEEDKSVTSQDTEFKEGVR